MGQREIDGAGVLGATETIEATGAMFTYRHAGPRGGVPLVALTHLGANLDGWDPAVIEPLARDRHVIVIGYRGVGGSTGEVRDSFESMAGDAVAVIRALGYERVDLFGLSMGGMVAQAVIAQAPGLVDRVVLAGSAPAGGQGLAGMTRVTLAGTARALLTFSDPKRQLFFTDSPTGRSAAREYQARLRQRTRDREPAVTPRVFRAQLAAVSRWARTSPLDLSGVVGPVLIVHGDADRMVPPGNAALLAAHLPAAVLQMFPDSGHGVVFQNHAAFVAATRDHLRR